MDYRDLYVSTETVAQRVWEALQKREAFSLVRLGDGEARVLAHDILIPWQEFPPAKLARLQYAGVQLPDPIMRQHLITHLMKADIVGLSGVQGPGAFPLLQEILNSPQLPICLDYLQPICSADIHLHLYRAGYWSHLWQGRRILLIGRRAEEGARTQAFAESHVVASLDLKSSQDIPHLLKGLKHLPDFDIALVSAGISAVILCPRIARMKRVVAFDFGHLMDHLVEPEVQISKLRILGRERWKTMDKEESILE